MSTLAALIAFWLWKMHTVPEWIEDQLRIPKLTKEQEEQIKKEVEAAGGTYLPPEELARRGMGPDPSAKYFNQTIISSLALLGTVLSTLGFFFIRKWNPKTDGAKPLPLLQWIFGYCTVTFWMLPKLVFVLPLK